MITAKPVGAMAFTSVRKEVRDFMKAAETLLCPVLLDSKLTTEECDLIKEYVITMASANHPWSKGHPIN